MIWIDFLWPLICGASMALAVIQLLSWSRRDGQAGHLLLATLAAASALAGVGEYLLMRASSPTQYMEVVRWVHVPYTIMVIASMAFVRSSLGLGRSWLFRLATAMRLAAVAINFSVTGNLHFREISALSSLPAWGGAMAPIGEVNAWIVIGQISNLLFIAFMLDAARSAWRHPHGEARRRMLIIVGSFLFWIALVSLWSLLVATGLLTAPFVSSLPSVLFLLVLGNEMGKVAQASFQAKQQLHETRQTLGETEQRLELALAAGQLGWWKWNAARDEFWMGDATHQLLHVALDQHLDRGWLRSCLHPDDRSASDVVFARIADRSGPFAFEFRFANGDAGTYRWLATRGQLTMAADGVPQCADGVLADITETKRSNAKFELAITGAPNAILLVDALGRIVLANPSAEGIFGYQQAELIGMAVEALVPDSLRAGHALLRSDFSATAPRGMAAGRELFGRRKNGGEVPIEVFLSPIESDAGLQVIVSVNDISERRRLERESSMQREERAHLSRVALLGELSASLAHELNQPLTAILSNAQAAIRFFDHDPPNLAEIRESLTNIVESDKRAGEVIRRLRAMLRKQPIDKVPLELDEVIVGVVKIIRSDLLNRDVRLVLDLQPDLPLVHGDQVQFQQVLLNLFMNASDAMSDCGEGDRMLTVATRTHRDGGVEVSVTDLGKGIAESDLERIFDPFFTSKGEGMGIGLTVCKAIVDAHDGRLWATNNAGPGATLHLWVPAIAE